MPRQVIYRFVVPAAIGGLIYGTGRLIVHLKLVKEGYQDQLIFLSWVQQSDVQSLMSNMRWLVFFVALLAAELMTFPLIKFLERRKDKEAEFSCWPDVMLIFAQLFFTGVATSKSWLSIEFSNDQEEEFWKHQLPCLIIITSTQHVLRRKRSAPIALPASRHPLAVDCRGARTRNRRG